MRLVNLTEQCIIDLFNTSTASALVAHMVDKVVKGMSLSYVLFVYTIMTLHRDAYVKSTNPDCVMSDADLNTIIKKLKPMVPDICAENILVADRMDILYGTDYRSYSDHSKFSQFFYEHTHEIVSDRMTELGMLELLEDTYDQTVNVLEYLISAVEQMVVFSSRDPDLDDTLVLCLVYRQGTLLFVMT